MTEQTPAVSEERGYRKALRGIVVSDKMDKTIVVEVEDRKKHSLYGKVLKTSKRVKAHDEDNTAGVGDRVRIAETRPLSASKRWRLVEVVERAKGYAAESGTTGCTRMAIWRIVSAST